MTDSVLRNGHGPSTWTISRVRRPGGTGTRTIPPPARPLISRPAPDTVTRLSARA